MRFGRALRSVFRPFRSVEPKPVILNYHRVADEPVDPWGLAVSPARFAEQLQVLRRTRSPLPLTDFVNCFKAGTLPTNAVAVTFDDGYADNLLAGKPLLAAADIPATIFLVTGCLDSSEEFWWDELARLVLAESGPQKFEVVVQGHVLSFDLGGFPAPAAHVWSSWLSRKQRWRAYRSIWLALRTLDNEGRRRVMAEIRAKLTGRHSQPGAGRAMSRREVRLLVDGELITIGAHTVTHPALTATEIDASRREIAESKAACEALVGKPVPGFAYPYGEVDERVRSVVEEAGFAFACSTRSGPVTAKSDLLTLPRVVAADWDGDTFERALEVASAEDQSRTWLTEARPA
jgi:peptidoglycan/xylan/chitin deacetylase (PgdA/CDA1 family)